MKRNRRAVASTMTRMALSALLFVCPAAAPAAAASYVVTKTADTNDGNCDEQDCSLREAVVAANASTGRDTVVLPAGTYVLAIMGGAEDAGATGDLDILDDLTIDATEGNGTVIDANGIDRALDVPVGATVQISGLTIRGGEAPYGGGIHNKGGVLTLSDCSVEENAAGADGGGTYNDAGALTIAGCTVSRNEAADPIWTFFGLGAGIYSANGSLAVTDCEIRDNRSRSKFGSGGGIFFHSPGGTFTLRTSTVAENSAYSGGGLALSEGQMVLAECTVGGNASTVGGGITADGGTLSVTNCTVSGNGAAMGGGIAAARGATALTNCTLTGNSADPGSQILALQPGSVSLANSLVNGDCSGAGGGSVLTNGGNLESPGNTCGLSDPTDQVDVGDPMLGPLTDNGGATKTHALLPQSPAIGRGLDANCPATDQREVCLVAQGDSNR